MTKHEREQAFLEKMYCLHRQANLEARVGMANLNDRLHNVLFNRAILNALIWPPRVG